MSARHGSGWLVGTVAAAAISGWLFLIRNHHASGEWAGVDDTVIGHFVEASGRPSGPALIDWVHGDLLLFAFLCAGLLAGFVIGFYARAAFAEQPGAPRPASGEARDDAA
jgi:hypothetical protein